MAVCVIEINEKPGWDYPIILGNLLLSFIYIQLKHSLCLIFTCVSLVMQGVFLRQSWPQSHKTLQTRWWNQLVVLKISVKTCFVFFFFSFSADLHFSAPCRMSDVTGSSCSAFTSPLYAAVWCLSANLSGEQGERPARGGATGSPYSEWRDCR